MHAFLFVELFNQAFQKPLWEGGEGDGGGEGVNRNCGNKRKKRVNIEKKRSNMKLKKRLSFHRETSVSAQSDSGFQGTRWRCATSPVPTVTTSADEAVAIFQNMVSSSVFFHVPCLHAWTLPCLALDE